MNLTTLSQVEQQINQLSKPEQLWLIERIIHRMRNQDQSDQGKMENRLYEMASDQEVQNELKEIEKEFFCGFKSVHWMH